MFLKLSDRHCYRLSFTSADLFRSDPRRRLGMSTAGGQRDDKKAEDR
jgi:hypothetical protein